MDISEQDAVQTARALATQEGICAGVSSGGSVFAALQIAKQNPGQWLSQSSVIAAIVISLLVYFLETKRVFLNDMMSLFIMSFTTCPIG